MQKKEQIWDKWNNAKGNLNSVALSAMTEYARLDAISFAEWKVKNGWDFSTSEWGTNGAIRWIQYPDTQKKLTTDELYTIYLNEKQ